ncbi:MAG: alpha-L-arabinofuranosidase C-terminal domain-containing protein [Prevotellaceae bacterium]|nr:alpha-L-arabinofuranosidase C-terminal domain-containing protein [Prevotellaceae bacterium]
MMKKLFIITALIAFSCSSYAKTTATVKVNEGTDKISKDIYGQFAEHLGSCIYGGLWVGENSSIPNINGYRKDVFEALKNLQVPVLRWPGGCFADQYHWKDGIGPKDQRPSLRNNNWGGTTEDNSFGTHEFLNLCEMLGCDAYISGNVGSGSVEELSQWIEYMTCEDGAPMAKLRKENGRDKAWKVKYLGIGNEAWGCGGNMRPEYYADIYRKYATYCHNYPYNHLVKVASGASDYDYNWTQVMMDRIGFQANGLSLHYYTVTGWNGSKGSATKFTDDDYYWTMGKCLEIEDVIKKHCDIMDKKDPKKRIALMVDEWGTWWDEEPGTVPGHLYQQNSMRDAMVAALSLNVFHRHTDRIKMANIAQVVNVLQSMILTDQQGRMVLTPTYHVFEMYKDFQEATFIPTDIQTETIKARGDSHNPERTVPMVSTSAAKKADGSYVLSITNVSLDKEEEVELNFGEAKIAKAEGRILTAKNVSDFNDFDHPQVITPTPFKGAKVAKGVVKVKVPAKSIIVLNIK